MASSYQSIYQSWQADPQAFWAQAAADVQWYEPWAKVLDDTRAPFYQWFAGGQLNSCYNALDYHVESGRAEQAALIYDSPVTDTVKEFSYRELRDEVASLAGVLTQNGVEKGDRVIIYMPMVPEAVMAMLACARIGAVHSVVFGGFAANELATRIDDAKPKMIMSASCGIEIKRLVEYKPLLDKAIDDPVILTEMAEAMAGLGLGPAAEQNNPADQQAFRALVVSETEPKKFARKIETRSTAAARCRRRHLQFGGID
ncbi:MAG TPA: hypothetical protein EYG11_25230 [Candidatus Latescibacteria bacterium]|nr:hypothetical protein [Candidatus Latescibacterota bacterium]